MIPIDSDLMQAISSGNTGFLGLELGTTMSDGISLGATAALPYVMILLLMVAAQYVQQWYSQRGLPVAPSRDGKGGSQQLVTKIMPLFVGFISWRFPAGLVLYWTTSNLVRLGQQGLIYRIDGRPERLPPVDLDTEAEESKERTPKNSHPASKKKRGRRRPGR